ncbi:MAG: hypothetical protein ACE5OR_17380 [bacterium]
MKILAGGIVAVVVLMAIIMGLIELNAAPAYAVDCPTLCYEQCGGTGSPVGDSCCRCRGGTCDPEILYCW